MPDSKLVHARLEGVDGGELEFQFNPTEYSVKKSAKWNTPPRGMKGESGAKPEYVSSEPQTITLQIFFDGWESDDEDVTDSVDQLFDWLAPSKNSQSSEKHQPSELKFSWGSNSQLQDRKFYLESVSAKYTMFDRGGKPIRATADISLKEIPNPAEGQNPTSGSIHARKTHLLSDGDTLQSIATREYGNPNLWRGIARFNDIDDPMRLSPGLRLLLPTADEATEISKSN
jgi:nucleoid-associated protein YgaU